jgi:hypothetical protein
MGVRGGADAGAPEPVLPPPPPADAESKKGGAWRRGVEKTLPAPTGGSAGGGDARESCRCSGEWEARARGDDGIDEVAAAGAADDASGGLPVVVNGAVVRMAGAPPRGVAVSAGFLPVDLFPPPREAASCGGGLVVPGADTAAGGPAGAEGALLEGTSANGTGCQAPGMV